MARPLVSDPYQNFRFHVYLSSAPENEVGGFNSVTGINASVNSVDYKEGIHTYMRKFPGLPSFDAVTFSRGVVGFELYTWLKRSISGDDDYRYDIMIKHYHRSDVTGITDFSSVSASRGVKLFNAFPTGYKANDFDSVSSDISIQEVTFDVERFEIIKGSV